jgi:putative transposase
MMKSCLLWLSVLADLFRFLVLSLRSESSLAAENLFLRKQLGVYQERKIKPRRTFPSAQLEHASRRIIHLNLTSHPTAAWTLQQLREAIPSDHTYRFILHDRDAIFSTQLDASVGHMGLEVIKTPVRSPQANSLCERVIGTLRRECLDWIIPLSEEHLRKTLYAWRAHYNRGRPHSSLGPGLPDQMVNLPMPLQRQRHRFDRASRVVAHPVLNGLHHEYTLVADAA